MKKKLTVAKSPLLSKMLLIMKVTTFFMIVFILHASGKGFSQDKLSFQFKKTEIAGILTHIEKETNYRFLYNQQLDAIHKKVTLKLEDVSLKEALDQLFAGSGLVYQFMQNNLVVVKSTDEENPPKTIKGKVTDENGLPLIGVSIKVKGTNRGTSTNNKGEFSIDADDDETLQFSYVGFDIKEVKVGSSVLLNISLLSVKRDLEAVIVIGYGSVKKKDLTGSVISVKAEEIRKVPAANIMESLQGKLPGVDIVRTNGAAGATSMVTVRGNRSILAQNGPLYIVDGIQYSNYQDINSNDIQSMEVLKDASSTAIYGSRGANGVIIITTKKGGAGKPKIAAGSYYGVSEVAGYPKPMTGPQYADLKRQSYRTIGTWNSPANDPLIFTSAAELAAVQNGTSTYWPGQLLNKGSQQDYGVSIGGGNEKTKAYFSFDYLREKGLLAFDYSNRYTLRLNIDQAVSDAIKVGVQSQLTYYNQNLRTDNVLTVANKVIPYYKPYDSLGNLVKFPGNANQSNPLMDDLPGAYINKTNTTRILSTVYAEWKPVKGFTVRSNVGISNTGSRNGFFDDANDISRALSSGSFAKVTNTTQLDITWENIINYQKKIKEHSIDLTAVTSYLSYKQDSSYAQGTGQLIASQAFYALQNNPANVTIWSNYAQSNLVSGAFRINYGYKGKYLLTATGRADGSSILAKENRWSFFPSVAAAWRISDENFMLKQKLINELKLRVSYGVSGNAALKPYSTQNNLTLIPFSWNDQSALAYGLDPQAGNPNLKWELTGTFNVGIDFGILKNRISGSIDVYDSRTHDLLLLRSIPASSGVSKVVQNIGKTRNNGIEIALRTVNIDKPDFSWSTGISFTHNKERIIDLVNGQNDIANTWFIGSPVSAFYDYEKTGIWQLADTALARTYGYKAGDIRVRDVNGDGKYTALDDRKILGAAVPKYSLGVSNDVRYKNFDLSVYVYARVGQMFVSAYANKFEPNAIENGANVDYWTPENPTNSYPRPNANISRAALPFATTLGYEDGSFVKIRSLTLGYTFPAAVVGHMHIGGLRLYASAKNYFTFSKVSDYDPEGAGSFERPLTKMIVTGLNINL
ncbi:MAG: TonB-dependent receptor [Ferruginibacter sp.]